MNKKKNSPISFTLLFLLSISLTLLLICTFFVIAKDNKKTKQEISNTQETAPKPTIEDIQIPNFDIQPIYSDTDLKKFPPDYDSILNLLKTSLSQHEKTTLLLYGQATVKTNYTNITDAYTYLIQNNIPILIPQEYINSYMNTEFSTLLNNEQIPEGIKEDVKRKSNTFRNEYEKYIYDQTALAEELPTANQGTTLNTEITSLDFLIPLEPQSINEAYYKLKVLKFLNKENTYLTSILDTLLEYSSDIQNSNTRIKLSNLLNPIIFNNLNNKTGIVYWNMFVFKDKTYVYPMYIAQEFTVNDANFNEPYDVEPLVQSKKSVRVPILMYHHIDPMPSSGSKNTLGLYVTPEVFEEQLAYLVKKNYKSITPQELYNLLKSGKNPSQKSVMITFDDSTKGQYIIAYPLLKKYGFTAVYFVPSKKSSITYAQLKNMGKNGMIIGSHSATHIDLVKEDDEQKLYSEIVESRYSLQSGTGQDVIFISYPGCVADSQVYPYVIQAGYLLGGSCGKSIDHYFRNRLSLSRVHVFNSLDNLKDILSGKP